MTDNRNPEAPATPARAPFNPSLRAGAWAPGDPGDGARLILLTLADDGAGGAGRIALFATLRRLLDRTPDARLLVALPGEARSVAAMNALLGNHPRVQVIAPLSAEAFARLGDRCDLAVTERADHEAAAACRAIPILALHEAAPGRAAATGFVRPIGHNSEALLSAAADALLLAGLRRQARAAVPDRKPAAPHLFVTLAGPPRQNRRV